MTRVLLLWRLFVAPWRTNPKAAAIQTAISVVMVTIKMVIDMHAADMGGGEAFIVRLCNLGIKSPLIPHFFLVRTHWQAVPLRFVVDGLMWALFQTLLFGGIVLCLSTCSVPINAYADTAYFVFTVADLQAGFAATFATSLVIGPVLCMVHDPLKARFAPDPTQPKHPSD